MWFLHAAISLAPNIRPNYDIKVDPSCSVVPIGTDVNLTCTVAQNICKDDCEHHRLSTFQWQSSLKFDENMRHSRILSVVVNTNGTQYFSCSYIRNNPNHRMSYNSTDAVVIVLAGEYKLNSIILQF